MKNVMTSHYAHIKIATLKRLMDNTKCWQEHGSAGALSYATHGTDSWDNCFTVSSKLEPSTI